MSDGQGFVPSLLFDLRPNHGGGNEGNVDLLQNVPFVWCYTQCPQPWGRPMPPPETPGHSRASLGQSLVGSLLLSPGSWCIQGFVCAPNSLFPQSCVSSGGSMVALMVTTSQRAYAIPRSTAPRAPAPEAVHC